MKPRLTAHDFDQELLILFDAYVHGNLNRRGFLAQAQQFARAGMTAAGLLAALSPDFAAGQQVAKDDARLKTERISYPSAAGTGSVTGYLARSASARTRKLPAVLVIHENRGLNPHMKDIARRLALDGRRRHRSPTDDTPARSERRRAFLRQFASADRSGPSQGAAAGATGRHRRAHQCRLASL